MTQPYALGQDEPSPSWKDMCCPLALIFSAWGLILFAFATNHAQLIDHDYLLRSSHLPWLSALGIFLPLWQVMTLAMMLPSSLGVFPLLASSGQALLAVWKRQSLFTVGYAAVWTVFAVLAFVGDTFIHRLVAQWFWLYTHAWVIGSGTLLMAGMFQFLPFKRYCLQQCCRSQQWRVGPLALDVLSPWQMGIHYGRFCVGSCWALMLVMFGLGIKSLLGVALLAAVIVLEKGIPGGLHLRPLIGIVLLLLALLWPILAL